MRKSYKIISSIIIVFMLFFTIYTTYAINIWDVAKDFLGAGSDISILEQSKDRTEEKYDMNRKEAFEELIGFLWGIGLLAIFATTAVVGIRYMFVSPKEKSKIKEITMPLVVGIIVIFGSVTIWKFVISILNGTILGL